MTYESADEAKMAEEGQLRPWWATFEKYDWEAFLTFRQRYERQSTPPELEKKTYELIIVAIDAFVAWPSPYYDIHLHAAFEAGATVQEVLETIMMAAQFGGGHALNHGIITMEEVIREREVKGVRVPRRRTDQKGSDEKLV